MVNILTIKGDLTSIYVEFKDFFINIWNSIHDFFLKYMSEEIFSVSVLAVGVIIVIFILLAIMNRN